MIHRFIDHISAGIGLDMKIQKCKFDINMNFDINNEPRTKSD